MNETPGTERTNGESLYNPDFFTEEALALKREMLDTFIYASGLVPQTFVFVTPQMMSIHAKRNQAGYDQLLFTQLKPEEKLQFGKQLERSRDNAHSGADIPMRNNPSTVFDLYDGLYKNAGVNLSERVYSYFAGAGVSDENIMMFAEWLREFYLRNKDVLREYKKALSDRSKVAVGSVPPGEDPSQLLQGLVNNAAMEFRESDVYLSIKKSAANPSVVDELLDEYVFPHSVLVG